MITLVLYLELMIQYSDTKSVIDYQNCGKFADRNFAMFLSHNKLIKYFNVLSVKK